MSHEPTGPSAASDEQLPGRRRLMKALAAGSVFATAKLLPDRWTRPIIDTIVLPVHAQTSPGELVTGEYTTVRTLPFGVAEIRPAQFSSEDMITVGNATFYASWEVLSDGYTVCAAGAVGEVSAIPFAFAGGGSRTGNELGDFSEVIPGGTLELVSQVVSPTLLSLEARYGGASQAGSAVPGFLGCNTTAVAQLSSPYPDDPPA